MALSFQTPSSRFPALGSGELHLWKASLSVTPHQQERLFATLNNEERDRADRFVIHLVRDRFIVARAALRDILGKYLGRPASEVHFAYGEHGKPELADDGSGICFNLSHTRNVAIYGVIRHFRVGVDVECLDRPTYTDRLKLAERFFSASESRTLESLPEDRQDAAFLRCWTRKEAFVKAIGEGLTCPLSEYDVTLTEYDPPALTATRWDPSEAGRWSLLGLKPEPGYIAAIAVEGPPPHLSTWQWHPET